MSCPDLTFMTLDPRNPDVDPALLAGWGQAFVRGFHEGRMDDERRALWLDNARTDGATLRGAWARPRLGDASVPVATFADFPGELNVGAARLPLHMITDVTVAPTHRRRGLLRTLMTESLAGAAAAGLPLAALTSTEGTIYGRFGFGVATHLRRIELDTTAGFALHGPDDDGTLELVELADLLPTVEAVFAAHLASTRGAVTRPAHYRQILAGSFDWEAGGPDRKLRGAVHLDAGGRPDGYVLYRPAPRESGPHTIDVTDLIGLTPSAHRSLWRFLGTLDLVERVRWARAPLVDPLDWALTDPRRVTVPARKEVLWLRVLDLPAVVGARPWFADGEVVLDVDDALGHTAGRWHLAVEDGVARVTRTDAGTDAAADVRLDVAVLGTLTLGTAGVGTLAAAGRLRGSEEAVSRLAAMADGGAVPYCSTGF